MKKKYLMMMLAVAVSASMMFTGCGNKSEEVAVDAQSTQETQTEVVDTVPETAEPTTEAVVSIPYGEENNWEFCEEIELKDIPFVAVMTDENDEATEIPGVSVEKISSVYRFTNIEEIDSDKDGMKKIIIDYVAEVNYDTILNELEYVEGTKMTVGYSVAMFEVCDYYSGMSSKFEHEILGDYEATDTGEWNWEWNGEVYPISYKSNTVMSNVNGTWESRGDKLFAFNSTSLMEVSIEIEAPKEYDGLVLMLPKEGAQELTKKENISIEMKDAMLDDDGNLRTKDELYIYRISDIKQKVADYKTESSNEAVEGEDYLSANGIKISPKVTEENCASELGLLSTEYDVYNCNFVTFDVGETETIVTVDFQLQHSDTYPNYYDFIVEFFDRYTGNNITKRPDVITESDIGETNLDARTDYTVSVVKEETVISEPVKHNSGKVSSDWRYKRVTYKITHPANYDGLVLMMASYDNQLLKTNNESFLLEDYKIMDKQEVYVGQFPRAEWDKELMVDREYWKFYTATDN